MSFETNVLNMSPIDVPSTTLSGTAFMRIVPMQDGRVRVERTDAGRLQRLNPFWGVWLRQLILQKTDPHDGFAFELRDNDVLISSNLTRSGLVATVLNFAVQIVPLPDPPIFRFYSRKFEMSWFPKNWRTNWEELPNHEALIARLSEMKLPPHVRVNSDGITIWLERSKRCKFKMCHLARMVELEVALHCRT